MGAKECAEHLATKGFDIGAMPARRFPPPWSVEDPDMKLGQDCFIVRDTNGHALPFATRAKKSTGWTQAPG
jgi:hypothetical protein